MHQSLSQIRSVHRNLAQNLNLSKTICSHIKYVLEQGVYYKLLRTLFSGLHPKFDKLKPRDL